MKPRSVVLGIAAPMKSGKTTISVPLAKQMGLPYGSFGKQTRIFARQQELDESIETLQQVGEKLITYEREQFCRAVLSQLENWEPGRPGIIDGIRHLEAITELRKLVAPSEFALVYISVDDEIRLQRLRNEGITDPARIKQIESASTEEQVKTILPKIADFTLVNEPPEIQIEKLKAFYDHLTNDDKPISASDLVKQGQQVYEKLKHQLEPLHYGRFVAIEPESEKYFLGDTGTEALVAAHKEFPESRLRFFLIRIGYETAHKIG